MPNSSERTGVPDRLPTFYSRSAAFGALAIAALLIASGVVDQRTTTALWDDAKSVANTYEALQAIERTLSTLKDAETGQRGFLLTGEPSYLEPYEEARRSIAGLLDDVQRRLVENSAQAQRIDQLRSQAAERLRIIDESIALRRANRFDIHVAEASNSRGKEVMDRIRVLAAEIVAAENDLLQQRTRKAEAGFRWSLSASWLAEGLGLIGLAAFMALLLRHMSAATKATRSLFEQRELLRTTLASIADAVVATDADGRVTSVNAVASALTGWRAEEAVGQPLETVFEIRNEKTRAPVESPLRRCLREHGGKAPVGHVLLVSRDGAERPIDVSAAPIRTTAGVVEGAVLVFRDATERKRAEDDLRRMAADLSEADRRKDEFLATLAHELRNPLAPMRNSLQILKLARADEPAAVQAKGILERQLAQMARLVEDILDVSRVARNKLELRREPVDLWSVVMGAIETSRPVADAAGHELKSCPPDDPIHLEGDPVRLGQIFCNLITNAAKYTPPGGRIEVAAHREGSDACVAVRDNGEGISPETLPLIFDMFMQADASLDRSQGGLGIGLTLVKRLTELHGGSVSAFSKGAGKGSEFVVRLPVIIDGPIVSPAEGRDLAPASTSRCKVVVVDDNRDAAQSLAQILRLMGHEARVCFDGMAAVQVVEEVQPNIVLLDIGLPKLNGYEACQRIRLLPLSEPPILVAVTGWGQDRDRRRAREAGFDHYFTKPVDVNQLLELVNQLPCTTGS